MQAIIRFLLASAVLAGCSEAPRDAPPSQVAAVPQAKPEAEPPKPAVEEKPVPAPGAEDWFALGLAHRNGIGQAQDAAKAIEWFEKAAAHGHAEAQYYLGVMHDKGEGVPKDVSRSVDWHQKAAAQGQRSSQFSLSWFYGEGEGVSKDEVLSYAYANLAAAKGSEHAAKRRDTLEMLLSAEQRDEGQRIASNWKQGELLRRPLVAGSAPAATKARGSAQAPAPAAAAARAPAAESVLTPANLPTVKLKPPPDDAPPVSDLVGPRSTTK
jgi:hypothetical protein